MGDSRRFDLFAAFIARQVPNKQAKIADVAAGKGYLSLALRQLGYKNVVAFEPKARNLIRGLDYRTKYFEGGDFEVIVGMHPDQATDVILDEATKIHAKAIVVPCCALPTRWKWNIIYHQSRGGIPFHRQDNTYEQWLKHLIRESSKRSLELNQFILPMSGRNIVLFGKM